MRFEIKNKALSASIFSNHMFLFFALIFIFIIGYAISTFFLGDKEKKIEILPMAFVVGLIAMGYFILLAAILIGDFAMAVWLFMALGGIYSAYFGIKNFSRLKNPLDFKKLNANFLIGKLKEISWPEIIFFLLFLAFFFDIFSKTIFYQDGAYKVAAAGYGDIPFHMAQVSYFIHNTPFALEEPIYAGIKLVYAFLINLLSAAFYILSGNYILSFNLPSYILLLAGFFFVYKFISAFLRTALARILAFLIFLLGAGAEALKVFYDHALWEKTGFAEKANYILHLPYSIVNLYNAVYPGQNNIWSSFMTMFLMHQRSFFFGFAAGAMILYISSLAIKNDNPLSPRLQRTRKYFYFVGLLIGFLPLVHMHTFIAVLIIAFGFCVWYKFFAKDIFSAKNLFKAILISAIIGSAITYFFILACPSEPWRSGDFSGGASLIKYRLGWMSEPGGIGSIQYNPAGGSPIAAWFSFLWENFGLFIPLLIIAIGYFVYKKNNFWQKKDPIFGLIIGTVFIFIIVNVIQFQPWDYDNGKIFGYFFLLGSIIIAYFFEQWKFRLAKIIAIILTFLLISVGLIDTLARSSLAKPPLYDIFGVKEQQAADWIIENTGSSDIILTGTTHLNPVDSLSGRPVLVGYPGWLWSHGIKYGEREADIKEIYRGGVDAKKLLEKYNVKYIYIGVSERYDMKANEQFFAKNYRIVFQEKDIKIYKVL